MLSLLTLLFAAPQASACGGFFCNLDQPVEQTGEDIVFSIDEVNNEVTTHIQVNYTGPSVEFAWIIPVSKPPVIELSTPELFRAIEAVTRPEFHLDINVGNCSEWSSYTYTSPSATSSSSLDTGASQGGGTVVVVDQKVVGPYETTTLQASSSELLLDWLQANGYDLPDDLDPVLSPYVASEAYFVALKLVADADTEDLEPLALTYEGDKAVIPIQLTSVAATPDMRLRVYVLGEKRAVPESYLHVTINEASINWLNLVDDRYEEAITQAANEAGGHAFATDYSGPTDQLEDQIYDPTFDLLIDMLPDVGDADEAMDLIQGFESMSMQFAGDPRLVEVLEDLFGVDEESLGMPSQTFFNCIQCYPEQAATIVFDADAFTAGLDLALFEPLRQAQALIDNQPHLTRLTSSLSPVEMTVDPVFVLNPDMEQEVSKRHDAELLYECEEDGGGTFEAERVLNLSDGREIQLPPLQWFVDEEMTEWEYMSDVRAVAAMTIEQTSASGEPTVIFNYMSESVEETTSFNTDPPVGNTSGEPYEFSDNTEEPENEEVAKGSCGCSTPSGSGGVFAMLSLIGLLARRRSA